MEAKTPPLVLGIAIFDFFVAVANVCVLGYLLFSNALGDLPALLIGLCLILGLAIASLYALAGALLLKGKQKTRKGYWVLGFATLTLSTSSFISGDFVALIPAALQFLFWYLLQNKKLDGHFSN